MTLPSYLTYSVNSDSGRGIRSAMTTRMSSETRKQDGFEFKGILLLVLCGMYALILFMVAKLLSYMVGRITAPVKSIFFSTSTTEIKPYQKLSPEVINHTKLERLRRTTTRSFNHG